MDNRTFKYMCFAMGFTTLRAIIPILNLCSNIEILDTRHFNPFLSVGPICSSWTWALACKAQKECNDDFFFFNMWLTFTTTIILLTFIAGCKKRDDKTRAMIWLLVIAPYMIVAFVVYLVVLHGHHGGVETLHIMGMSTAMFGYASSIIHLKWPCRGWFAAGRRGRDRRPVPTFMDYLTLVLGVVAASLWLEYARHTASKLYEYQVYVSVGALLYESIATFYVALSRYNEWERTFSEGVIEGLKWVRQKVKDLYTYLTT